MVSRITFHSGGWSHVLLRLKSKVRSAHKRAEIALQHAQKSPSTKVDSQRGNT
jgi:hypothetical protein